VAGQARQQEAHHDLRRDHPGNGHGEEPRLLLGFFFLSVGMAANLSLAVQQPWFFAMAVPGMIAAKIVVCFLLSRLTGHSNRTATRFAFALPQGSEFSFVLFAAAIGAGAMTQGDSDRATLAIALSMAATPLLFAASEKLIVPRTGKMTPPPFDAIQDDNVPVIICGFGRVGQIVGRVLTLRGIAYTALEQDSAQVEVIRRFGTKIYYGSPSRPDLLRAAGADHAKLLVVALENMEESVAVIDMVRRTFPNLKILARARNRRHAHLLMDRGIEMFVRETFLSSLRMGEMALQALGVAEEEAHRAVKVFEDYDERQLQVTHSFYEDEGQVIQSQKQAAAELAGLFEMDQEMRMQGAPVAAPAKRRKDGQVAGTD
jgi:voltage-gated potassium channel Kch